VKFSLALSGLVVALVVLAHATPASASTFYVSQEGGKFSGGKACDGQSTIAVATFDSMALSPGDVVWLCGTLMKTVHIGGSGHASSVITVNFDTGASISLPVCNDETFGPTCLALDANSYITIDGGEPCGPGTSCSSSDSGTGIIEATENGTGLAYSVTNTSGINASGSNIAISNLVVRNLYRHTSTSDTGCCGNGDVPSFYSIGSNNTMHDCTLHDMGTAWRQDGTGDNISFFNNELENYNWGFQSGTYGTIIISNYLIHDNHFGSSLAEDDVADHNHHDDIFIFGDTNDNGATNGLWIYNNLFDGNPGVDMTGRIYLSGSHPYNCAIYNNVFVDSVNGVANADIEVTGGTANSTTKESTDCGIYNNTVIGASITNKQNTNAVQTQGVITFENNALTNAAALINLQDGSGGGGPPTIQLMDYNAYGLGANGTGGSGDNWQEPAKQFNTLAGWQTYAGEAHSTWTPTGAVPGLGLSATGVPRSGSPLIAAGANLSSLCTGNLAALCSDTTAGHTRAASPRPKTGPWTVGAYEYGDPPLLPDSGAGPEPSGMDGGNTDRDGGVSREGGAREAGTSPSPNVMNSGTSGDDTTTSNSGCSCHASDAPSASAGWVVVAMFVPLTRRRCRRSIR
jgi:MYXO-CTERM domain-containing protein